jgi:C1A family cysteine protease
MHTSLTVGRHVVRALVVACLVGAWLSPAALAQSVASAAAARAAVRGALAPVSPAFQRWLDAGVGRLPFLPATHGLGRIPSPLAPPTAQPSARTLAAAQATAASYPSSYDLRTSSRDTKVDDQGPYGTCWAFATIGALESDLRPGDTTEYSEDNLVLNAGFDTPAGGPYNNGGYSGWTAAYLLRWGGPVTLAQDAYGDGLTPPGLMPARHLQQWLRIPAPVSAGSPDTVKAALVNYGALDTAMYWTSGSFSGANVAYYYSGTASANHEIDIVGWDDTYSLANFNSAPPGDGAFLCRNSWGTSWGAAGYFWVSYYDKLITSDMDVFPAAESATNYARIYQYDPLGETRDYGYGSTTGWMANRFTAAASESLAAVGIWIPSGDASYVVYGGTSLGDLTELASGTAQYAGFQTVTLPTQIALTAGSPFVVAVRMTTPGYNRPIPIEYPYAGYSSIATASAGQSYVSSNGSTWTDLTTPEPGSNVCLKAYTVAATGSDLFPPRTTVSGSDVNWHRTPVALTFTAVDNGGTVKSTQYSVDDGGPQAGDSVTIPAPAGGGNDGVHTVAYWSTDAAGNKETPNTCSVRIDTVGPTGTVTLPAGAVRSGRRVLVGLRVDDARSPQAHVVLVVRRRSGRLVKRVDLGLRTVGAPISYGLCCDFGRGRFVVTLARATADLAGNQLRTATSRRLTVVR